MPSNTSITFHSPPLIVFYLQLRFDRLSLAIANGNFSYAIKVEFIGTSLPVHYTSLWYLPFFIENYNKCDNYTLYVKYDAISHHL